MGLDLSLLMPQMEGMVRQLGAQPWRERLDLVLSLFREQASHLPSLRQRIAVAKTTWLVAGIAEEWSQNFPLPPGQADFAVVVVDGSHIPTDRHLPAPCYVINLGLAYLKYGQQPQARLESHPKLFFREEDLVIRDPTGLGEERVEGVILGIKRTIEEVACLSQGVERFSPDLALVDGSLILWGLAGHAYPPFVREALLNKGFLPALSQIREAGVPVAGYVSSPHSTEVVNILRLALCPYPVPDCDRYCRSQPPCGGVAGVEDRHLFSFLQPGERSPLFFSRSTVVVNHYGEHQVLFFYIKGPAEVCRVEIPAWARERVDLIHRLVFDQCQRGRGYPIALMEAHQQAVITTVERENFWALLSGLLEGEGLPSTPSPKRWSKQAP